MEKKMYRLRYWNSNGVAVAIVAVANYLDGDLFDWAAYIGGTTKVWDEEDAYDEVARYGTKLDIHLAHYLVEHSPTLTKETYRQ